MRCCWTAALWKLTERESLPLSWSLTRCRTAEDNCQARPEWRVCQRRRTTQPSKNCRWLFPMVPQEKTILCTKKLFLLTESRGFMWQLYACFPSAGAAGPWWENDGSGPLANKFQTDLPAWHLSNALLAVSFLTASSTLITVLHGPGHFSPFFNCVCVCTCVWTCLCRAQRSTLVSPSAVSPVFIVLIENFTYVYNNIFDHNLSCTPHLLFFETGSLIGSGSSLIG